MSDVAVKLPAKLPAEPSADALRAPLLRYFLATRPAFLTVTAVGVLLGWAHVLSSGLHLAWLPALLTLCFALIAHAGVNVLNDYYDHVSGCDAQNRERIFPFTGGSRFIQNGVLTPRTTAIFGTLLLLAVIPPGLWLALHSGPDLLWIGAAGLAVGWAYSAPPLKLASRGLGELAIAAAWWLVVVGSDFVQRGSIAVAPLAAGIGYGLMVANLLYINQFPDATADACAGKLTQVARLGRQRARIGYLLIAALASLSLVGAVALQLLPLAALLALLALLPAALAARHLWRHAEQPDQLAPAIKLTILAAHLYGLLLAAGLMLNKGLTP